MVYATTYIKDIMKIIAGSLKGALIPTVKTKSYRPSTGKFKEALFSILTSMESEENSIIIDKIVLDLFSGTGSLAFEAISRGAKKATLIDIDQKHLDCAKSFATKHNILDQISFLRMDASNLGYTKYKYDLVFIDPPYMQQMVDSTLVALTKSNWLNEKAIICIETGKNETISIPEEYIISQERIYGASKLWILEKTLVL